MIFKVRKLSLVLFLSICLLVNTANVNTYAAGSWRNNGIITSRPSGETTVNTPIQLKANVSGNIADLSYKFVWMRNNWNPWGVIRDFTKDDKCTWTPTEPGEYTLYLDVKNNSTGVIETNKITYRVAKRLNTPCIIASKPSGQVAVNTPIQLQANVSGNIADLSYKFVWMRNNWNPWGVIRDFTKDDKCTWTPTEPGEYTLYLDVKNNSTGVIETNKITYRVKRFHVSTPSITANKTSGQVTINTPIQLKANVSGNKAGLSYKFVWMRNNWNPWGVIRDFTKDDTCTWTPTEPGEYTLYLDVKNNSTGVIESNKITYRVAKRLNTPCIIASKPSGQVAVNTPIQLQANVSGNIADLSYKFVWMRNNWNPWGVIRDFTKDDKCTWTPKEPGDYTLYLDVKNNSTGAIESSRITYRVERFYINTPCITASRPSEEVVVNTPIQLKANVSGNKAGLSYKFVWMRNNWTPWDVIRKFTKDDTCTWTPKEPGDYTLYLDVKDASGIVKTQTIKYRVAAAPKSVAKPVANALSKSAAKAAPKSAASTKPVPKPAAKAAPKSAAPAKPATPAAKAAPKSAAPAKPAAPAAKPASKPTQAWNITGIESTISCPAVGDVVLLSANVSGNKDGLKMHAFSWKNKATGKSGTIGQNNFHEGLSVEWKPGEPGDYVVSLTVKDRNNIEKSMQKSVLVSPQRKYVGIINRGYDCSLISALQLLFNDSEFKNLVLGLKIKDEKLQPYTSKLQKQFRNMDRNPDAMEVSFSEDEVLTLTQANAPNAPIYDLDISGEVKCPESRLLARCIEECRNVGDAKTVESIRNMFDFNYDGKNNAETSLCFIKIKQEDGIVETLKKTKHIPKSINICLFGMQADKRKMQEKLNESFEIHCANGTKRKFEIRKVLIHTGGHFYVAVKDLDTRNWIELNDGKVEGRFETRNCPGHNILQCVFEEVK